MKAASANRIASIVNCLVASIWLVNGIYCKLLNLVPRHEQIVSRIVGREYSGELTVVIGIAEVGMAVWILSGVHARSNAVIQIAVIAAMNITEFLLVPELLLWGRWNALFAALLTTVIYLNEFHLKKPKPQPVCLTS